MVLWDLPLPLLLYPHIAGTYHYIPQHHQKDHKMKRIKKGQRNKMFAQTSHPFLRKFGFFTPDLERNMNTDPSSPKTYAYK